MRTTAAGRRSEGVCSSKRTRSPLKTLPLAFRKSTLCARSKSSSLNCSSTLRITISQVLRYFLLLLLPQSALQGREDTFFLLPLLILVSQRWLGHFRVKLAQPLIRTQLGSVLHLDRQQQVGVFIACGDPVGGRFLRTGCQAQQAPRGDSRRIR